MLSADLSFITGDVADGGQDDEGQSSESEEINEASSEGNYLT